MNEITEYVLRRKKDVKLLSGWFISKDSCYATREARHTSSPDESMVWNQDEIGEVLKAWGQSYEAVRLNDAKEVE